MALFFVGREMWLLSEKDLTIFAEKNAALVQTPSGVLIGFGAIDNLTMAGIRLSVQSFFASGEILEIKTMEVGKMVEGADFALMKLNDEWEMGRGSLKVKESKSRKAEQGGQSLRAHKSTSQQAESEKTVVFIGKKPEGKVDLSGITEMPIELKSDVWILRATAFPDIFPPPRDAIVFLGDRAPGKSLITFATEHELPLISIGETGGAMMEWDGAWEVEVREK